MMHLPLMKEIISAWSKVMNLHRFFELGKGGRSGSPMKCSRAKANLGKQGNAVRRRRAHNVMAADSRRDQRKRAA
jgi:hypothetical protein